MENETVPVAITHPDGSLSIMSMATQARGSVLPYGAAWFNNNSGWWRRSPSPDVIANEIGKIYPFAASWRRIEPTDVIAGPRTFRDAWVDNGTHVVADIVKARDVKVAQIRKERREVLANLDAEWMKHTGQGNKQAAADIEAQRQKWRDAPADPRIAAAQTVDDLLAIVPG